LVVTQTPLAGPDMTTGTVQVDAESRTLKAATHNIKVQPSAFQPGGFLLLSSGLRSVVSAGLGALTGGLVGSSGLPTKFQGSASEKKSTSSQASVLKAATEVDRVSLAHDRLIEIMNNGLLVTVAFKGRLYVEYVLTSVELIQAAGKFGQGTFKVEARAFRTVTGTSADLPDPADFKALKKINKGNKPALIGPLPPPEPMKSDAAKLQDGGGAYLDQMGKFLGF
jgi:hypothetical protein